MKIIRPEGRSSRWNISDPARKKYTAYAGCGCAVLLLIAAVALPAGAGVPKAMGDPGIPDTYVPDMMVEEPAYSSDGYSVSADTSQASGYNGTAMPIRTDASELIIDIESHIPADSLVVLAEEAAGAKNSKSVPEDTDAEEDDYTYQDQSGQTSGYRPHTGTSTYTIDRMENQPEYDGEIAALRQEVAALRQQIEGQSGGSGQQADDSEVAALKAEIARLQAELDAQQKAANQQAAATETQKPESGTIIPNSEDSDVAPPDWLIPDSSKARTENTGVPSWLYGTFMAAVLNNPYDGGPLCKTGYAEVPTIGYGTRIRCELDVECRSLTQGDLLGFVQSVVLPTDARWVTIIGSDGKGIQFTGGVADYADYGALDEYGRVIWPEYCLTLTEHGYDYTAATAELSGAVAVNLMPLTSAIRNELPVDQSTMTYMRVVPGVDLRDITQTDFRQFAYDVVALASCDWISVFGIDGNGIQFYRGNPDTAYYGYIDPFGRVSADYVIQWDGSRYSAVEIVG